MTLPEMLAVLAIGAVLLLVGSVVSVPWLARESMRSGLHDASVLIRVARMEAVSRNRPCSFRFDVGARTMSVMDMNGTSTPTDDVVLASRRLAPAVALAHPTSGPPITFEAVGGSVYQVVFHPDGYVSSGTGELVLYGGERYSKLVVYSAGGVRHQRWNGSSWGNDS